MREGLLGLLSPRGNLRERLVGRVALASRGGGRLLGLAQRCTPFTDIVTGKRPPGLERLALEALVQLGGLGLALERAQPRTCLALDVQRAVEVVLRALELELRAPAALAVLAEPRGLLDQQPAVAWLGGDDRLHPALGDDRV